MAVVVCGRPAAKVNGESGLTSSGALRWPRPHFCSLLIRVTGPGFVLLTVIVERIATRKFSWHLSPLDSLLLNSIALFLICEQELRSSCIEGVPTDRSYLRKPPQLFL